jgi:hypothetical protein
VNLQPQRDNFPEDLPLKNRKSVDAIKLNEFCGSLIVEDSPAIRIMGLILAIPFRCDTEM